MERYADTMPAQSVGPDTVRSSLSMTDEAVLSLESIVSDLEDRVNGCVPRGVSASGGSPKEQIPPPYVGVQIHASTHAPAIARVNERLINLLQRL